MRLVRKAFPTLATFLALQLGGVGFAPAADPEIARGVVFHDVNANGVRDEGEPGIEGVPVSNGYDVTVTCEEGRWELPIEGDTVIFMTKPSGYAIEVDETNTPQFFYVHRPDGSPPGHPDAWESFRFEGVAPTGPLPESIDFPLREIDEPEDYRVVLFADPQPRTRREMDYFARRAIGQLRETAGAYFGMTLGDILFDDLSLFDPYVKATSHVGIPFYGVIGNHDLNFDAEDDFYAGETYIRYYGPRTYSFNVGRVHYVAMDNNYYRGWDEERRGTNYRETFRERDLEWLRRNLEHVPEDYLVVLATHSPIWMSNRTGSAQWIVNSQLLFDVMEGRDHILAVNGHTHYTNHRTFGPDDGWHGDGHFHQHNIVTVSGSWWSGPRDPLGIPTGDQRDGTPSGYVILEIEGNSYTPHYRGIGLPAETQMRIYPPPLHAGEGSKLLVNVFDGMMDGGEVHYALNGGSFERMEFAPQLDPVAVALYEEDSPDVVPWANPITSYHMWEAALEEGALAEGINLVEVRYHDTFGREFRDSLVFLND